MSLLEILAIGTKPDFQDRVKRLPFQIEWLDNFDAIDIDKAYPHKICLLDGRFDSFDYLSGSAQVATQCVQDSNLIMVVKNKMPLEELKFLYQSGVNLILSEDEFLQNQKLEFFINHHLHNQYIPVKSYDFVAKTTPKFKVYHLIASRGRFLPVFFGEISESKFLKAQEVNELYIHKSDLGNFADYVKNLPSQNSDKLLSRCRAKYLEFYEEYIKLIFTLTDNSKYYTFDEGRELLGRIQTLAGDLLHILASAPDPWLVVNNLSQDQTFTALCRAPAVAAYTGITSLDLNLPNPTDAMLSCLLADIGLLELPYQSKPPYNGVVLEKYLYHPTKSINLVLERKVPLPENIKQIILHSHENLSGSGFPKGDFNFNRFPLESQVMQICQLLDEKSLIQAGQFRPKLNEVKEELINNLTDTYLYDLSLVMKIKNLWTSKKAA